MLHPAVPKYVYAILTLPALALAAWQASDGDWLQFAGLLLGSLGFGTAASNTPSAEAVKAEDGEGA